MSQSEVVATVRKLRLALNDTQQSFAQRMKWAISSVVRYESSRPPRGKALAQLEQVAVQHGLTEYAAVFRSALAAELGLSGIEPPKDVAVEPFVDFRNKDEKLWCAALLLAMRTSEFASDAKRAKHALKKAHAKLVSGTETKDAALHMIYAVGRLMQSGASEEEITAKSALPPAAVRMLIAGWQPFVGLKDGTVAGQLVLNIFLRRALGETPAETARALALPEESVQMVHAMAELKLAEPEEDK